MASFTHWDYAAQFSGHEAAALILGIEPEESDIEQSRIRVVIDRMKLHYTHALKRRYQEAFQVLLPDFLNIEAARPFELASVKMNELCIQCDSDDDDDVTPFTDWLASDHETQFDNQGFARHVVADWLEAIGLNSIYQFTLDAPRVDKEVTGHWPWGDHHTELLGHLEAAAKRYYRVNYEPTDATTAPLNTDVSEWLTAERKVSQKMAASIASMLRPDGLATGPRK